MTTTHEQELIGRCTRVKTDDVNVYRSTDMDTATIRRIDTMMPELIKCAKEQKCTNIIITRSGSFPFMPNSMYFNTYINGTSHVIMYQKLIDFGNSTDNSRGYSTSFSSSGSQRLYVGHMKNVRNDYTLCLHGFLDNIFMFPSLTNSSLTIPELKTIITGIFEEDSIKITNNLHGATCELVIRPVDVESTKKATDKYRRELTAMYTKQITEVTDKFKSELIKAKNESKIVPEWLQNQNEYSYHIHKRNDRVFSSYSYVLPLHINKITHRSFGVFNVESAVATYMIRVHLVVDSNNKLYTISLFNEFGTLPFIHPHSTDTTVTGAMSFCLGTFNDKLIGKPISSLAELVNMRKTIDYLLTEINASSLAMGTASTMKDVNDLIVNIENQDSSMNDYLENTSGWTIVDKKLVDKNVTVYGSDEAYDNEHGDEDDDEE